MSWTRIFWVYLLIAFQAANTYKMDLKNLTSAITKFSTKFCNELPKDTSVVSSPLSAEFLLSLITLGCSEPAHSELLKALGIPDNEYIRSSFSEVASQLKSIKGITLNIANKVYVKDGGYELVPQLKDDAVKVFNADIEKANFDNGPAAADLINKWVESKTNNRIKELLNSDSINSDSRLVLVNALYFKGNWKKKFDPQNTLDMEFYVKQKEPVLIPMMYMKSKFNYGESQELDAQLLEIPYEGDQASMLIVLPREVDGLESMLQKLASGFDLIDAINKMLNVEVQVTLPKFKIETSIDLKELLPKLGIKAIFDRSNSGLTRILDNNEALYVSEAVQKAFIEVNEEGAEAAAATAFGIMMTCAMVDVDPVKNFVANRPFFATILINKTPYFTATYYGN